MIDLYEEGKTKDQILDSLRLLPFVSLSSIQVPSLFKWKEAGGSSGSVVICMTAPSNETSGHGIAS